MPGHLLEAILPNLTGQITGSHTGTNLALVYTFARLERFQIDLKQDLPAGAVAGLRQEAHLAKGLGFAMQGGQRLKLSSISLEACARKSQQLHEGTQLSRIDERRRKNYKHHLAGTAKLLNRCLSLPRARTCSCEVMRILKNRKANLSGPRNA